MITAKQRVLRALAFEPPDRTPIWTPNFHDDFVKAWRAWKQTDAHPLQHYRHDTVILNADERFFPSQAGVLRRDSGYEIVNNGWGCIVRVATGGYFWEELERTFHKPSDLERLEFEPAELPSRYAGLEQQAQTTDRCAFTKIGGLYVRSHFLWGEERLLMDMAGDEAFCDALFDRVAAHFTAIALETLQQTHTYDTGLFVYDDIASSKGPMFSPRMFRRYFLPRYQALIAQCRAAGCRHFYFHSDGNVAPLLDLLIEAGFEGINPLEPRCNPSLPELREQYGRKLALTGGICNTQILPRHDSQEIESHLRPLWELARHGGVVLGMASVPPEIPPAAYDLAMRLIDKWDAQR